MLKFDFAAVDAKIEQLRNDLKFWEGARAMFADPRIAEVSTIDPSLEPPSNETRGNRDDLSSSILQVINLEPYTQWTSRTILSELRRDGIRLPNKDDAAMNAVSLSLFHLVERGEIVRIHEGRGRDPHRYAGIDKENNSQEAAEATS